MLGKRNELQLNNVLDDLIEGLRKAGVIKTNDAAGLKEKVLKNLEAVFGKGNLPTGPKLKDPRMIMKLTACIVAAHVLQEGKAQSLTQQIFLNPNLSNSFQLEKLFKELITEMENNPELGNAKNFKLLMNLLLKEAMEEQNELTANNNPNSPDNTFMFVVIGGVVVDVLEGVFGKTKAELALTGEEIAAMGGDETQEIQEMLKILTFGEDMRNAMNAMETRPTLTK